MKDRLRGLQHRAGAFAMWALARLSEPSTWTGIGLLIAAFIGHELGGPAMTALTYVGPAIAGALFAYEEKKHGRPTE